MESATTNHIGTVAVLGWGNSARGDDALGPRLIELLAATPSEPGWPELRLVDAHQLQIEHALDLMGCDLAIFVDAALGLNDAYEFQAITPAGVAILNTHGLEPAQLLAVYSQSLGLPAPTAYILEISGTDFEVGHPLSATADANLRLAFAFIVQRLGNVSQIDEYIPHCRRDGRNTLNLAAATRGGIIVRKSSAMSLAP